MKTYTVAAIHEKNNASHAAGDVAAQIQKTYQARYNINLEVEAGCVASDTCPVASNAADVLLGADQHDCEMHVVNLVMAYGLGLKKTPIQQ